MQVNAGGGSGSCSNSHELDNKGMEGVTYNFKTGNNNN
jgi:hypothetical protein